MKLFVLTAAKMRLVITHADELSEERFGMFVAKEVKTVLEKIYECGVEIEAERKDPTR